jgi:hypothetical protein
MEIDTNGSLVPEVPKDAGAHAGHVPVSISHGEILLGASVVMDMDRVPYATSRIPQLRVEADRSPDACARPGAPFIEADGAAFKGIHEVIVHGCGTCSYRSEGKEHACEMEVPFSIDASATVTVTWDTTFAPVQATFTRIATDRTVTLQSEYASQYAAGGQQALVDGLRGGTDFRTGEWQGFEGHDLLATIDLGHVETVTSVGLSVLQDVRSWIWFPADVQFAFSANGRQWSTLTVDHGVALDTNEALTHEMTIPALSKKARYIKVIARNIGTCPEGHPGKGGKAWIFADEVLITVE